LLLNCPDAGCATSGYETGKCVRTLQAAKPNRSFIADASKLLALNLERAAEEAQAARAQERKAQRGKAAHELI
jgi:hypothetical protein